MLELRASLANPKSIWAAERLPRLAASPARSRRRLSGRVLTSALLALAFIGATLLPGAAGGAKADETKVLEATGLTQPAGALTDPANRLWVSDRIAGFCRITERTASAAGGIETSTCLGGTRAGATAGPVRPGAPSLLDPTPSTAGSGDELALVPDSSQGSVEVTRAIWNPQSKLFQYQNKLSLFDGDLRPKAVSVGIDGNAYVIFERARAVVRILDPADPQPEIETIAYVTTPAPLAIAAGERVTSNTIAVYVAETSGLREFVASPDGVLASATPHVSYSVGGASALVYDPKLNALYSGSASASVAGQDVVKSVNLATGQVVANWATGYSRITGLALRAGRPVVLDDAGLISTAAPTGTGSLYLLGQPLPRIVAGPTAADGSQARDRTVTNDATPTFTVASDGGDPLQCSIFTAQANPVWTTCASGSFTPSQPLPNGSYTFAVRSGSTGAPVGHAFSVDTTAPGAPAVTAPVNGQRIGGQVTLSAATESGASLVCTIGSASARACVTGELLVFPTAGTHTLTVWAVDGAGNTSRPTTVNVLVELAPTTDTVPPVVSVTPVGGQYPSGRQITLVSNEPGSIHITTDGSAPTTTSPRYTAPITLTAAFTLRYIAVDSAGNMSAPGSQVYSVAPLAPVAGTPHDFSGDGRADVLARDSGGALWLYPGTGVAGLSPRVQLGTGWAAMTAVFTSGDFNGDAFPDVFARDSGGTLWLYPGDGAGGLAPRVAVGSGWNIMSALVGTGDFNGDKAADVLARDTGGALWLYRGNGSGGWGARVLIGSGWNVMTSMMSPGDFNGDTFSDVLARDGGGALWLYPGNGSGGWRTRVLAGSGWGGMTAIAGPGDLDGNRSADVLARDAGGTLWLYPGNGSGGWLPRKAVGTGWNSMTAIF